MAISDHASIVMLPTLTEHLARVAPGVRLILRPKVNAEVSNNLTPVKSISPLASFRR